MAEQQWYFNMESGKPELGPQSPMEKRLGPYQSREEAQKAWEIAHDRNEQWDEESKRWRDWQESDKPSAASSHAERGDDEASAQSL